MEGVYENNEIRKFEIKIFASGNCESFVPMSFVEIGSQLRVTYHTEGYKQLDISQFKTPYEILDIVEKLVLCIKEAHNHLILQSRFYLIEKNIYINQNMTDIKIKYVPISGEQSKISFSKKFELFLKEMCIEDMRCCEYINMVIERLENFNLSMGALVNYLGELKREAYLCGWA